MIEFGFDSFGKQWVPPSGGAPVGPTYDPTAQALFSRFAVDPTTARKNLINDRIIAGKASTWWAKLDAIWVHAAHAPEAARLNWLGDRFNCIPINNPTFTVDRGYMGNGSSSYLDTQFNPYVEASKGSKYQRLSASLGIRSNTDNSSLGSLAGFWDGAKGTTLNPRRTSTWEARVNQASLRTIANPEGSSIGMFVIGRRSATEMFMAKNGTVSVTNTSNAAAELANGNLMLGAISASSLRACQFSMGFIGAGLTDAEVTDIYNWFEVYRIAVGVV